MSKYSKYFYFSIATLFIFYSINCFADLASIQVAALASSLNPANCTCPPNNNADLSQCQNLTTSAQSDMNSIANEISVQEAQTIFQINQLPNIGASNLSQNTAQALCGQAQQTASNGTQQISNAISVGNITLKKDQSNLQTLQCKNQQAINQIGTALGILTPDNVTKQIQSVGLGNFAQQCNTSQQNLASQGGFFDACKNNAQGAMSCAAMGMQAMQGLSSMMGQGGGKQSSPSGGGASSYQSPAPPPADITPVGPGAAVASSIPAEQATNSAGTQVASSVTPFNSGASRMPGFDSSGSSKSGFSPLTAAKASTSNSALANNDGKKSDAANTTGEKKDEVAALDDEGRPTLLGLGGPSNELNSLLENAKGPDEADGPNMEAGADPTAAGRALASTEPGVQQKQGESLFSSVRSKLLDMKHRGLL